jgi:hypothetical protein
MSPYGFWGLPNYLKFNGNINRLLAASLARSLRLMGIKYLEIG